MDYTLYSLLKNIQTENLSSSEGVNKIDQHLDWCLMELSKNYSKVFENYYRAQRKLLAIKNGAIAVAINRIIEENAKLEVQIAEAKKNVSPEVQKEADDAAIYDPSADVEDNCIKVKERNSVIVGPGAPHIEEKDQTDTIIYPLDSGIKIPDCSLVVPPEVASVISPSKVQPPDQNTPPKVAASSSSSKEPLVVKLCMMKSSLAESLMVKAAKNGSEFLSPIPDPCIDSADNTKIALDFFKDLSKSSSLDVFDIEAHLNCGIDGHQCSWFVYVRDEKKTPNDDIYAVETIMKSKMEDILLPYVATVDYVSILSFRLFTYAFNIIVACGCVKTEKEVLQIDVPTIYKAFPGQKTKSKGFNKSSSASEEKKTDQLQKDSEAQDEENKNPVEYKTVIKISGNKPENKTKSRVFEEKETEKNLDENTIEAEGVGEKTLEAEEEKKESRELRKRKIEPKISEKEPNELKDKDSESEEPKQKLALLHFKKRYLYDESMEGKSAYKDKIEVKENEQSSITKPQKDKNIEIRLSQENKTDHMKSKEKEMEQKVVKEIKNEPKEVQEKTLEPKEVKEKSESKDGKKKNSRESRRRNR